MMKGWDRIVFALALSAITVIIACSSNLESTTAPTSLACGASNECPKNSNCREGLCVSASPPKAPILLRISPPQHVSAAATDLESVTFDDTSSLDLGSISLTSLIQFTGTARLGDGSTIPVRVTARTLTDDMPPLVFRGETISDANGARFALRMPDGWPSMSGSVRTVVYSLFLYPLNEEIYPPWRVPSFQAPAAGSRITIELPDASLMAKMAGTVRFSSDNPTPVRGCRVFAVDEKDRVVSSSVQTDADGQFEVGFWPNLYGETVNLKVMSTASSGPIPEIIVPVTVAPPGQPQETLDIELGVRTRLIKVAGSVTGVTPVSGAALRFSGAVGRGIYRVEVPATDSNGRFEISMYPGEYEVDIIPPVQSRYRLSRLTATIDGSEALEFRPQPRTTVTARVETEDGVPIAGARVKVTLARPLFTDPSLVRDDEFAATRGVFAQTDDNGGFVLQLDPGEHSVDVRPPPGSGLVNFRAELKIPALESAISGIVFTAPTAAIIDLMVNDQTEQPLEGVLVEAWRTDTQPRRRVSVQRTDATGRVRLPIPNSPMDPTDVNESP